MLKSSSYCRCPKKPHSFDQSPERVVPHFLLELLRPIWLRLPPKLRRSQAALRLKGRLLSVSSIAAHRGQTALSEDPATPVPEAAPAPLPATPRMISTLAELDEMLRMLDEAAAISDDELRRGFTKFVMDFQMKEPADPDSKSYRAHQMKLYEWLHGKPYAVTNEVSSFDVAAAADVPFPYQTKSSQTVGNQLIAIGHLIKTLDLKPESRVLEFGPGWGNTTISLARMGHRVTAIDIEKNFVELIKERARRKNAHVTVLHDDFSALHRFQQHEFDAILFFECFHHCANHQALVAGFDRVIAPGGKVVFAAEPITDAFPLPWGLRLDGESLWAIRKNGWLELGFQESYFRNVLKRYGWKVDKSVCSDTPWGVVFTATRIEESAPLIGTNRPM